MNNKCAFDKDILCSALLEKSCALCPFYKTEEKLIEGRRKAITRINRLPLSIQSYIRRKYSARRSREE